MNSTLISTRRKAREDIPRDSEVRNFLFWENVSILFKATGMLTWFFICLLALLEIKRYFNIDFIPGYDSALDDMYGAMRSTLTRD